MNMEYQDVQPERSHGNMKNREFMIRQCNDEDFQAIYSIINDAAEAYRGIIPADLWKEPYMSMDELRHEMEDGVVFWGIEHDGEPAGIMGVQNAKDVTLIRHADVRTEKRNQGIGSELLTFLRTLTTSPVLIGTWADAVWAIRFYEKHGFHPVSDDEKTRLLKKYWSVPERQVETSVVLAENQGSL